MVTVARVAAECVTFYCKRFVVIVRALRKWCSARPQESGRADRPEPKVRKPDEPFPSHRRPRSNSATR